MMIVSTLVLATDEPVENLRASFGYDSRIEFGEPQGGFVPVIARTQSLRRARHLHDMLRAHPGVNELKLLSYAEEPTGSKPPDERRLRDPTTELNDQESKP
jgi:hypothetical protein